MLCIMTLVVHSQKMQCYDRILQANVKMLIFILYSRMSQNIPMFLQFTVAFRLK